MVAGTQDLYCLYPPNSNQVIASWSSSVGEYPYYAIFDGTTWSAPAPISMSLQVLNLVFLMYFPQNNTTIATWGDKSTTAAYYSVYNGMSWSTPAEIDTSSAGMIYNDVTLSYDPTSMTIMGTWASATGTHPYYALYNGTTWTSATLIDSSMTSTATNNVYTSFDSSSYQTISTWSDGFTSYPTYSAYNGAKLFQK